MLLPFGGFTKNWSTTGIEAHSCIGEAHSCIGEAHSCIGETHSCIGDDCTSEIKFAKLNSLLFSSELLSSVVKSWISILHCCTDVEERLIFSRAASLFSSLQGTAPNLRLGLSFGIIKIFLLFNSVTQYLSMSSSLKCNSQT
ncbi:PREDICTED: uncharacterized protein LOC108766978 [Trachymyrmex cornetzi]|uniref:uncharacterized protein LOC108766978 n=1 Tax=Trachymyrmex cornetzi TaxID=471704 RepID=UPI00084F3938|nr:PREDICTED: uncharacterized protein LOC108766978 [Trachymyrmex cornetzi]XP_018372097.1 PREDICTED: uncharacterized protein LOC108766978 [Trachymyrmex cornetzi]